MKKQSSPRFEVDFKTRLQQKREATNAVCLPRLGYKECRVYDIKETEGKKALNALYGQQIGRGIRKGPINIVKSSYHSSRSIFWIIDEWFKPSYTIKWLKPKQATLLRLKGHCVEEI